MRYVASWCIDSPRCVMLRLGVWIRIAADTEGKHKDPRPYGIRQLDDRESDPEPLAVSAASRRQAHLVSGNCATTLEVSLTDHDMTPPSIRQKRSAEDVARHKSDGCSVHVRCCFLLTSQRGSAEDVTKHTSDGGFAHDHLYSPSLRRPMALEISIRRLHVNLGHCPRPELLRTSKHVGAS